MNETRTESSLFVILGTGDLYRRKLLPALCHLEAEGHLHEQVRVLAVGRSREDEEKFRESSREALAKANLPAGQILACVRRLHYHAIGEGNLEDYRALGKHLEDLGRKHDLPSNRTFYMSLPPQAFPSAVAGLGGAGLNRSEGWTRLVVEKPFGQDLASARELNELVHEHFREDQIYRIDHYLGKETVQNLLVFRLTNAFIESSWNRDRVHSVQITVGEQLGVGTRAQYYDNSGALRDMVQNHLTQLLTLVAMEVPASFSAAAIRSEKIKVLNSIAPIVPRNVVRAQYTAGEVTGERVPGYLEEEGVPKGSQTETFVAMKLFVDSWRWEGVPFYLRTGKRMPQKTTQIAVRFRAAPISFFEQIRCTEHLADVLTITLQPNEGFAFHLDIKRPGAPMRLEQIPLRFSYEDHFGGSLPDGYETLLLDVLNGDQTLFVHAQEAEESWRLYTPLLENPTSICGYAAGTWGPPEAESFAIPETDIWQLKT